MTASSLPEPELQKKISGRLPDVLIRAGFIAVLAALCYIVFAPFLTLMVWAIILAVIGYFASPALLQLVNAALAAKPINSARCRIPTCSLTRRCRASGSTTCPHRHWR